VYKYVKNIKKYTHY